MRQIIEHRKLERWNCVVRIPEERRLGGILETCGDNSLVKKTVVVGTYYVNSQGKTTGMMGTHDENSEVLGTFARIR